MDIEQGAPGYAAFVNQIRERAEGCEKHIYITAAPQCPFPDANIGQALNDAPFDAMYGFSLCVLLWSSFTWFVVWPLD